MSQRQLSGEDGHRWDVEDEGHTRDAQGADREATDREGAHQLRFRRDDGTERVRTSPRGLDQLADRELRALLQGDPVEEAGSGPDLGANQGTGYGDADD